MNSRARSHAAGRAAKRLPALVMLAVTVVAVTLMLWEPWRAAPPAPAAAPPATAQPADGMALATGTPESGGRAADPAALSADGDDAATTATEARTAVVPDRVIRGTFRAPHGAIWPGGGHAELHPARVMPEGGFIGAMGEIMAAARKGNAKNMKIGPVGAEVDIEQMFRPTRAVMRTAVDGQGAFVLEDPPAGRFQIILAHAHLRITEAPEVDTQEARKIDLGELGTDLAGSLLILVSDDQGRPVEHAEVRLGRVIDFTRFSDPSALQDITSMFGDFVPVKKHTDERGACRFEGLEEDNWEIGVEADGLVDDQRPVQVIPGLEDLVRIELTRGASLAVRVLDPAGKPHHRARVRVSFPDAPPGKIGSTLHGRGSNGITKRTGEDGSVLMSGLPEGRAQVKLTTTGYRRTEKEVTLAREHPAEVDFRLDVGQTVSGRVLDEDGEPIEDARVMHLAVLGQDFMGMDVGTFVGVDMLSIGVRAGGVPTDEDGRFTLGGFELDETAHLIATAERHDPARVDDVRVGSSDVEFRLNRSTTLVGTVLSEPDGEPVEDFEVRLEQRAWLIVNRPVVLERFADLADGHFTVEGVPRDRFNLVVAAPGRAEWSQSVDLREGTLDIGEIRLGIPAAIEGLVVDPDGLPVVGAKIRVAKGGAVDSLMMAGFFGSEIVESDAAGQFRVEGLSGRRVRLLADKDGFAPLKSKTITLAQGETTTGVMLQFTRGGRLRGHIVDADGRRLGGWRIQMALASGRAIQVSSTDEKGEFFLEGLAAGTHKIEAFPGDYMDRFGQDFGQVDETDFDFGKMMDSAMKWSIRDSVVIRENEEAEIELVFDAPEGAGEDLVTVTGQVRVGGRALDRGMVTLFRAGSSSPVRFAQVRDGAFEMAGLRPGAYRAQAQGGLLSAMIGQPQEVRIPAGPSHALTLDLPGGSLEGRVIRAEDGLPAGGVVLTLSSSADRGIGAGFDRADIGEGTLLTDGEGRFRFDGLGAGSYEIFAKELMVTGGSGKSGRLADLTLGDGERRDGLDLLLKQGGTLRLSVRDAAGEARANAVITLLRPDGGPVDIFHRTLTDPDGVAILQVPEGRYRAAVDAPRAAPRVTEVVEVVSGAIHDLDVELSGGCAVELRLTGEVPRRATGVAVSYSIWQPDGALLRSGRLLIPPDLAASGNALQLGSYAPGRYRLRVSSDVGSLEREESVPDRATHTVTIDAAELQR